jgi:DNA-binding NarL/FixJ family response regulator
MPVKKESKTADGDAYLVLDDDVRFAASMKRLLSPYGDVTVTHSVAAALRAKAPGGSWKALFLDFDLPDGDAFDCVKGFHERGERCPTVIITGHLIDSVANRAFELGVKVLAKPIGVEHVRVFLDGIKGDHAVRRGVEEWRVRYGLTRAETAVLRDAVEGVDRGTLAERRGISETTVRTHVRHMLQKTGDANLSDAIQRFLREVIVRRTT